MLPDGPLQIALATVVIGIFGYLAATIISMFIVKWLVFFCSKRRINFEYTRKFWGHCTIGLGVVGALGIILIGFTSIQSWLGFERNDFIFLGVIFVTYAFIGMLATVAKKDWV
ncbi:MAG: hypothetical protein FWE01_02980 [Firmicutes bacterium]|nr:hypothetical protein [Bacillota bacterium]